MHWQFEHFALIQEHVAVNSFQDQWDFHFLATLAKHFPFSVSVQPHNSLALAMIEK